MLGAPPSFERLARIYRDRADVVIRGGVAYPAAVSHVRSGAAVECLVRVDRGTIDLDPRLIATGSRYVARVRARAPQLYDGPVLAFDRLDGDTIVCLGGRYFEMLATTDVLRDEYMAAGPDEELPLRDLAHTAAAGDPLRSGTGRAAAVGMTLVVTLPAADGRAMLLGRRRGDLGADPGSWHVPPSGMIEPGGSPLRESVVRELREELGLQLAEPNLVPLGIGWDLLRLRPEVCLRLDLGVEDVSGSGPTLSPSEYVETARIPLSTEGLKDFWQAHPPPAVTPAAAAAIALVEGGV